jgi:hypothetical protein
MTPDKVIGFPATVERFIKLRNEEIANCSLCQKHKPGEMMPSHFLSDKVIDGQLCLYTGNCGGNGRRFNPVLEEFVGNAHCTCDACF